ncbi:MAG: ATP-binding protein [Candidatus Zixiibacteriota bacterium]
MNRTTTDSRANQRPGAVDHGRDVLALEALSHLAEQFARDPDLQGLIDALALTVAGQFGVTSAYVITRDPQPGSDMPIRAATGRFRGHESTGDLDALENCFPAILPTPRPHLIDDPAIEGGGSAFLADWRQAGARLLAPLVIDGKTIGLLLLGQRIGNAPYTDHDLELLQTLIATITPLIANSFLFAEMSYQSARHLRTLDSVQQAILVFDAQGILLMANRTAVELVESLVGGGPTGHIVGLPMASIFPEAIFPGWVERLTAARQDTERKLLSMLVAKDSEMERIFSARMSVPTASGAADEESILTLQDITIQHDNERRMFELEKFAEQGIMASSISHELNNHLGIVLGGIELALANLNRGNQEKLTSTLDKLRENVVRMERFTAGLMDFARVNAQKQLAVINDVVTDVLSFAMAQKRFSRITVKADLAPRLPAFEMDRDQIAQVIINLLNNAADAIAETGRRDGVIIVSTSRQGESVTLSVSDNGRGMTPEVKDQLFKTHLTTKPKGHGYGLVTCARILEHHGASFAISSQIGFGTAFEFRFPLNPTKPDTA